MRWTLLLSCVLGGCTLGGPDWTLQGVYYTATGAHVEGVALEVWDDSHDGGHCHYDYVWYSHDVEVWFDCHLEFLPATVDGHVDVWSYGSSVSASLCDYGFLDVTYLAEVWPDETVIHTTSTIWTYDAPLCWFEIDE